MNPSSAAPRYAHHLPPHVVRILCVLVALALLVTGCSPALNWREVRDGDAGYTVLLPAKPASFERSVDLDGLRVMMHMTAAEANDTSFAVATAVIDDASQQTKALAAMQTAMIRNIQGTITEQKTLRMKNGINALQIRATGQTARGGKPLVLFALFLTQGKRVFQVVALGPQDKLDAETADTFLRSLSFN